MLSNSVMESLIEQVRHYCAETLADSDGSHNWEHTLRVYNLCVHIGKVEGADMDVLAISAYMHDIGRSFQDESKGIICHAEKGAEMAEAFLEKTPLAEEKRKNIIHSILAHRFRGGISPATLEAKVLFDADKLDSIGAIGIARAFQFAGEIGARLYNPDIDPEGTKPYTEEDTGYREFKIKLCKIKDRMLTQEGRRLARQRHIFMENYFNRFIEEHAGLK